jgi:hypothetical protein
MPGNSSRLLKTMALKEVKAIFHKIPPSTEPSQKDPDKQGNSAGRKETRRCGAFYSTK